MSIAVRESLGGVQTFANPYATGQSVELPTTHKYYWIDRQGRMQRIALRVLDEEPLPSSEAYAVLAPLGPYGRVIEIGHLHLVRC